MSPAKRGYSTGDEPVPGYRLGKRLGRGQFGEVWQATAAGGIDVALKIIDLGGREGIQEFTALQQVKHVRQANLIPLHAAWLKTEDGTVLDRPTVQPQPSGGSGDYAHTLEGLGEGQRIAELIIAMGLASKSLFDRLRECQAEKQPGIPLDELLKYMEEAAQGIDYLNKPIHDLGWGPRPIIHCDIKPHNLLIVGDAVQVGDFGLARAIENLRRTATVMATFAYAAPELLDGKRHVRSDQYCLAVTYTELRTGELPFSETNPLKVAELHRRGKLDLSRLPRGEQKVIRKATSPNPDRRWNTCTEMVAALREVCKKPSRVIQDWMDKADESLERRAPVSGTAIPVSAPPPAPSSTPSSASSAAPASAPSAASSAAPASAVRSAGPSGRTGAERPDETQIYHRGPTASYVAEPKPKRRWVAGLLVAAAVLALLGTADVMWLGGGQQMCRRAVERVTSLFRPSQETEDFPKQIVHPIAEKPPRPASGVRPKWDREKFEKQIRAHSWSEAIAAVAEGDNKGTLEPAQAEAERKNVRKGWEEATKPALSGQDFERLYEDLNTGLLLTFIDKKEAESKQLALEESLNEAIDKSTPGPDRERWEGLLERIGKGPEARLIKARRLIAEGDWPGGLKDLEELNAAAWKGGQPRALYHALMVIAIKNQDQPVGGLLSSATVDRLLPALKAYGPSKARAAGTGLWALKGDEADRVEDIQALVLDALLGRLPKLLEDPKKAEGVRKSAVLIDGRERKAHELAAWDVIIKMRSPALTLEELKKCLDQVEEQPNPKEPWRLDPDTAKALSEAVEHAVSKPWPPAEWGGLLDRAIALCKKLAGGSARRLGALLAQRVKLRVTENRPPDPKLFETFETFEKDWRAAERSGYHDSLVNWWRAECLVEIKKDPEAARELVPQSGDVPAEKTDADMQAYCRYVRCLVWQGQQTPSEAVVALKELFSTPVPRLQDQGRLTKACRWAFEAAAVRRKEMGKWRTFPPANANPFESPTDAEAYYDLLSRAMAASPPTPKGRRDAALSLTLAASGCPKPDWTKIDPLVKEILDASAQAADQDEARVYYAYLRNFLAPTETAKPSPKQDATYVRACIRLLEFREAKSIPTAGSDTDTLKRLLHWPPHAEGVDSADLERYCWGVARFMTEQGGTNWADKNLNEDVTQLLSRAIELYARRPAPDPSLLAQYHASRGRARAEQPKPELELVLADAKAAIGLDDALSAGHAIRSQACLLLSRCQARRGDLLEYLKNAIDSGERAVKCPDTERYLPSWLLNLSSAYVEKANYEPRRDEKQVDEWLNAARKHADRAVALPKNPKYQADYPYLALGNAYEDLAWLAEVDPEKNYLEAINAFREAAKQRLYPAQASTSIGRCYCRALMETFVKPEALELANKEAVLDAADKACVDALKADANQAEASLNRALIAGQKALIAGQRSQWTQADEYYGQADKYYEQAKEWASSPDHPMYRYRLMYIAQWVRFPLSDRRPSAPQKDGGPSAQEQAAALAKRQAAAASTRLPALTEDLPSPPGGYMQVDKERAYVQGQVSVKLGGFSQAITEYSRALPDSSAQDDRSDYDLLIARSDCEMRLYDKDREVFARAADDAQRATNVALTHSRRAMASYYAFLAHSSYCITHSDPQTGVFAAAAQEQWLPHYRAAAQHGADAVAQSPRNPLLAGWLVKLAQLHGAARHVLSLPEQFANLKQCNEYLERALGVMGTQHPDYQNVKDKELWPVLKALGEAIGPRTAEIDKELRAGAGNQAALQKEREELDRLKTQLREVIDAWIAEIDQALASGDQPALREKRQELDRLKTQLQ